MKKNMDFSNKRVVSCHHFAVKNKTNLESLIEWSVDCSHLKPYSTTQGSWCAKSLSLSSGNEDKMLLPATGLRIVSNNCKSEISEYIPLVSFSGKKSNFIDLSERDAVNLSSHSPRIEFQLQNMLGDNIQIKGSPTIIFEFLLMQVSHYF